MITLTFISFHLMLSLTSFFFFFNDPATPEIYTLSLHDALPICKFEILKFRSMYQDAEKHGPKWAADGDDRVTRVDRKSTRLNSSHMSISYAVFCLKKKKNNNTKQSQKKTIQTYRK